MVIATLVLLCALPQEAITHDTPADSPAVVAKNINPSAAKLPESPAPKIMKDSSESGAKTADTPAADAAASIQPGGIASPIKPARRGEFENRPRKKIWYGLMAVGHGAAVFDAWSTRRAVAGGYGAEANPFLRGASHSNMIYAATQVSPAVMDFLGRKMMTSRHGWVRKLWWLPQTAGAGFSISAGVHNMQLVP